LDPIRGGADTRATMRRRRPTPASPHATTPTGLTSCPLCRRDYVVPIDWEPVGEDRWWIFLRCGECGISRDVTVSDAVAQRYDGELQRSAAPMMRAADRLETERLAEEAEGAEA
jgi:hypothetical protein